MIRRPSDMWPEFLLEECRRFARWPVPPIAVELDPKIDATGFRCRPAPGLSSPYFRYCQTGQDYAGLLASVQWLREGPKIADATEEQWQALSRVAVPLAVGEVNLPYPSLLVNMPPGKMHRYVLLHRTDNPVPVLIACSVSHDHTNDIVTVARDRPNYEVEEALGLFNEGVSDEEGRATHASLRVAINLALAMTNYGCLAALAFPGEAARDRKYAAKDDKRAQARLKEHPTVVTLDREVKLYRREGARAEAGPPTGREMPFHWRRGHWHRVRIGTGRTGTKLVLYPATMVRADLMAAPADMTTTTYTR